KVAEGMVLIELEPAAPQAEAPAQADDASPAGKADADGPAQSVPQEAAAPAQQDRGDERPAGRGAESTQTLRGGEPPRADVPAGNVMRTAPVPAAATDSPMPVPHASPSVRKFARELGVDLHRVRGSGPKQRITHDDVRAYVKGAVAQSSGAAAAADAGGAALGLLPWPKVDFSKFGPVESKPLSRIQKLSGANLHRNWVMIPHVTNNDEADITDLEALRVQL